MRITASALQSMQWKCQNFRNIALILQKTIIEMHVFLSGFFVEQHRHQQGGSGLIGTITRATI